MLDEVHADLATTLAIDDNGLSFFHHGESGFSSMAIHDGNRLHRGWSLL